MNNKKRWIRLKKLLMYLLKRSWILLACAAVGFASLCVYTVYFQPKTYTASGSMYVLIQDRNANASGQDSAAQMQDTYMMVIRSKTVLNRVAERLSSDYPGISPDYIAGTLSKSSDAYAGVLNVACTTDNPRLSRDICNAVLDAVPSEIIRVTGAEDIEIIDDAALPGAPDSRFPQRKGLIGALAGACIALAVLIILFLLNRKVDSAEELTDNDALPILASIKRSRKKDTAARDFIITADSPVETLDSYAKLRMNLFYRMADKEKRAIEVTSSLSGEGKSTISANLSISCAMSGKRVLLIDADMRRACQKDTFCNEENLPGLSDVLNKTKGWKDVIRHTGVERLDLLPAGPIPPNPAELLSAPAMARLIDKAQAAYDLIILDVPPINLVSDPLILSTLVFGCLFVARQHYSDHREIKRALTAAEMAGMNVMGIVFYGENIHESSYYGKKYEKQYASHAAASQWKQIPAAIPPKQNQEILQPQQKKKKEPEKAEPEKTKLKKTARKKPKRGKAERKKPEREKPKPEKAKRAATPPEEQERPKEIEPEIIPKKRADLFKDISRDENQPEWTQEESIDRWSFDIPAENKQPFDSSAWDFEDPFAQKKPEAALTDQEIDPLEEYGPIIEEQEEQKTKRTEKAKEQEKTKNRAKRKKQKDERDHFCQAGIRPHGRPGRQ